MQIKFLEDEKEEVINLINGIFNTAGTIDNFKLGNNQRFLIIKNDNHVIGTTLITEKNDPIKGIKSFYLDYVCVKKEFRHMGLAKKMFSEIEKIAKEENVRKIELTSNNERKEAIEFYKKEVMKKKDTNLFEKYL